MPTVPYCKPRYDWITVSGQFASPGYVGKAAAKSWTADRAIGPQRRFAGGQRLQPLDDEQPHDHQECVNAIILPYFEGQQEGSGSSR